MFVSVAARILAPLFVAAVAVSGAAAPNSRAARPLPRPYTPAQLRRAFLGQGVEICAQTLPGCPGIGAGSGAGLPHSLTWFATITTGSRSYDLTLVLHDTAAQSADLLKSTAYSEQIKPEARARIGNLYIEMQKAERAPRSQPRAVRDFPAAVRRALAVLTGVPFAPVPRVCRALAAHPLPGAAPVPGGPCPTLPAAADTDEAFFAPLGRVGRSQAHVLYRIYGSVLMAKQSWPRDADEQPSGYAIGGPVPGLAVPSMRWLPQPPFANGAAATVLVGQVLATVELDAPKGRRGDVKEAAALARRIAAYLKTVESRS